MITESHRFRSVTFQVRHERVTLVRRTTFRIALFAVKVLYFVTMETLKPSLNSKYQAFNDGFLGE